MKKLSFKERKEQFTNTVFEILKTNEIYTKQQLVELTGFDERSVRKQIQDISKYYGVISFSAQKGYRLANPNLTDEELIRKELNDIQHAINEDKKRADEILARVWRKVAVAKVLEKKLEEIANGKEN